MHFQWAVVAFGLVAAACATPSGPTPAAAAGLVETASPNQAFVAEARAKIEKYVADNQFSGAVLVAKDGQPVLREGFALANRELGVPVKPETVFRLGSITKQFTAAAIMQLVEQGKIGLDDPVSKYYAAAPAAWSKITVKHLLNHRSGIPSYTGLPDFFEKHAALDRTPEQVVEFTRDMPLEFEPGAKFEYNNTGYVLLGYIIEKVSGQTYADYLVAHIFTPLGMKHSGYDDTTTLIPQRAAGYGFEDGVWTNAAYLSMTLPHAAGSLYSTVDDLLVWEEALFAGKVVSRASFDAMTTDYGGEYGFGLGVDELEGHESINHSGGIPGFSTYMTRFPDDGLTVIALSNLENGRPTRLANDLARLWLGLPEPAALVAVTVKPEVLERYVGVYELMPKFNITVARAGDGITVQATGQSAFPLTSTSDTEFHFQQAGVRIVFPAGDGPAQSLTLFQGGERTAKRIAAPN
ncbi:MAG: serine hydrolase [Hyphomonadaceae bacterium]|nr:serine hydrolase [Hyphomonadaceae bacterium]